MTGYEAYLGPLVSIITVAGGMVATIVALRITVKDLKDDVVDLKTEVKKLADVMITQALQGQRVEQMDKRMLAQGQRLDELRLGLSQVQTQRFDTLCEQLNRLIAAQGAG